MSGSTTPATTTADTTDALCVYCVPKPDGTPTTLHSICIGYDPQRGVICSCDCPNATRRRATRGQPWVRQTTWMPGTRK